MRHSLASSTVAFRQIAGMFLELPLEALEKGNGVGGGTGESRDDLVVVKTTRLAGGVLHHVIAHGHLAVGDEHDLVVLARQSTVVPCICAVLSLIGI